MKTYSDYLNEAKKIVDIKGQVLFVDSKKGLIIDYPDKIKSNMKEVKDINKFYDFYDFMDSNELLDNFNKDLYIKLKVSDIKTLKKIVDDGYQLWDGFEYGLQIRKSDL